MGGPEWVAPEVCSPVAWATTAGVAALVLVICVPAVAVMGTSPAPTMNGIQDDAGAVKVFHWATRVLSFVVASAVAYLLSAHVHDIAAFHVVIQLGVVHSIVSAALRAHHLVRTHVFIPLAPRCARWAKLPAGPAMSPHTSVEMVEWPTVRPPRPHL